MCSVQALVPSTDADWVLITGVLESTGLVFKVLRTEMLWTTFFKRKFDDAATYD
jgi:hypothetical protein